MSWNSCVEPIQARRLELEVVGDTRGRWDGLRLQQLLRNLVSNAIKYGAPDAPVRVVLTGEEADVRIEVVNSGPAIERSALDQIFDPLKRGPAQRTATIPTVASGSDCISCAKLPGRMGARSMCVPTREKPCSLCACLAAMRLAFPDQHLLALPQNQQEVIRMAFLEEKSQREFSPHPYSARNRENENRAGRTAGKGGVN